MTTPIPMLPGRTLTDDTLLRLALYGLATALDLTTTRDGAWVARVIADAGIDVHQFRLNYEMNTNAGRRPSVEMMDELKACGLV